MKTSIDFDLIPVQKATTEEKNELDKIMRRGNKVFHTYHERIKAKLGTRYSRAKFRKELFQAVKLNPDRIEVQGIVISKSDFSLINQIKNHEFEILMVYSRLIYKLASRWNSIDSSLSFEDYYNEIVMAAINAIYGFVKDDVKFITYLQHAIVRKLLNVSNENKPLSAWTNENKKLYGEFERKRTEIGKEIGFDEIVKKMNLSERQVGDLRSMLTKVIGQSEFGNDHNEAKTTLGIYSAVQEISTPLLDVDQMEAIRRVPMTDWERKVFDAYLHGGRGWASDIARNTINPETGQEYSRRAPKIALDRVLERIKESTLPNVLADVA